MVFDRMISKDDISWGSIAHGYMQHEDWQLALEIFRKMISEDIKLNTFILSSMLKACGILGDLRWGQFLHYEIVQNSNKLTRFKRNYWHTNINESKSTSIYFELLDNKHADEIPGIN